MKWFCLAGILLLGVLSCKADDNDLQDITKNSEEEFFEGLKDFFEEKCKAHGGVESIKKIADSISNVQECLERNLPADTKSLKESFSDKSDDICSSKRKDVRGCFDDLVHVWEACSAADEKYIAKFFFDAVDSLLDYVCADEGAVVLSLFNDDTFDCVYNIIEQDNIEDVCTDQFTFSKGEKPEEIVVTKDELCSDLNTVKTCYGKFIHKICPKETALRDAFVGAITAISSPCEGRRRRDLFRLPLPYFKK